MKWIEFCYSNKVNMISNIYRQHIALTVWNACLLQSAFANNTVNNIISLHTYIYCFDLFK